MYEYLEQVNLDLACVMQSYKCVGEDANRPLDVMNVDRVNVKTSGEPVSVWRGRREEYALLKLEEERLRKRHLAAERKLPLAPTASQSFGKTRMVLQPSGHLAAPRIQASARAWPN